MKTQKTEIFAQSVQNHNKELRNISFPLGEGRDGASLFSFFLLFLLPHTHLNMKKIFLCIIVCIFAITQSYAQLKKVDDVQKALETTNKDTIAWAYGGVMDIGINEGFLHNWAAGGELASLTVNGIFSGHLDRLHKRDIWSNNLDMTYGLTYAYSQDFLPHKTDDRIDFTSKYGYRMDTVKNFYFTTLFNFKSQFTKGYDYTNPNWRNVPTSTFFSPAYFTTAIGFEYRKGSDISLFLSPFAARLTLADKDYTQGPDGAFGIPHDKTSYYELGAYFSGRYQTTINKKLTLKTRVDLYCNYLAKNTKDSTNTYVIKKDNPGNISVLFDNLVSWKVSKFFNFIIGATFIYDNNIPYVSTYVNTAGVTVQKDDPGKGLGWLQVKQVFTLGFEYKF